MENDQIVKHPDKIAEFRTEYTAKRAQWQRELAEKQRVDEQVTDDEEEKSEVPDPSVFRDILEGRQELTDDKMQQMMGEWMQEAGQMEEMNKMFSEWGNVWEEDARLQMAKDPNVLTFQ